MRSLPATPDISYLRAEAKLRRRSEEFPSITHAQLAIAREFGFSSWPVLKLHVGGLTLDVTERAALLIDSATSADLRAAQAMLDTDPALARYDMACACVCGDLGEVTRLLEAQPKSVNDPTGPKGWPPILYACFSRLLRGDRERAVGIREVVWRLLVAGADPNASFIENEWLQVALYGAAGIAGDPELTRMLLDAGAEPTDERDGYRGNETLYHACEFQDPTCARLVIDAGAKQEFVNHALGRALNFPNHDMIEIFCTHGARASASHLRQAVWSRRPAQTVTSLIDAGAPVDEADEHGLTPLRIAISWGEGKIAQILRTNGANEAAVTAQDRALGRYVSGENISFTVEHSTVDNMLLTSIQTGNLEAMCRLLDAGTRLDGDPDAQDTPLGHACWRGRPQAVRELVERGAALEYRSGRSALGATLHGSRHCHDPEGGTTMRTLDEVPQAPYAEIVRILLAAGARIPKRSDAQGRHAAMRIAELGVDPPA